MVVQQAITIHTTYPPGRTMGDSGEREGRVKVLLHYRMTLTRAYIVGNITYHVCVCGPRC